MIELPGQVEVLCEKQIAGGRLVKRCSAGESYKLYHVLYDMEDEPTASAYLETNLARMSEYCTLEEQKDGKRWYHSPLMPMAISTGNHQRLLDATRASLVLWQEGAQLHKLFCSELATGNDGADLEQAQVRARERCAALLK